MELGKGEDLAFDCLGRLHTPFAQCYLSKMIEPVTTTISLLALTISSATAWLTLFRRGTVRMSQPTVIFFGPDQPRVSSTEAPPKVYLRTLLFSTSKRGRVNDHKLKIKGTGGLGGLQGCFSAKPSNARCASAHERGYGHICIRSPSIRSDYASFSARRHLQATRQMMRARFIGDHPGSIFQNPPTEASWPIRCRWRSVYGPQDDVQG